MLSGFNFKNDNPLMKARVRFCEHIDDLPITACADDKPAVSDQPEMNLDV